MKRRLKLTGKNVRQQRQQAMFTGLMNQVQQQKQVQQQNLQVILSQQNKVFIALLENSKKQWADNLSSCWVEYFSYVAKRKKKKLPIQKKLKKTTTKTTNSNLACCPTVQG